jgi:hypothetical protein
MWFLTLHRNISLLSYHNRTETPVALCLETPQCLCVREVAYLVDESGRGKRSWNDFDVCPITSHSNGNLGRVDREGKYKNNGVIDEI